MAEAKGNGPPPNPCEGKVVARSFIERRLSHGGCAGADADVIALIA